MNHDASFSDFTDFVHLVLATMMTVDRCYECLATALPAMSHYESVTERLAALRLEYVALGPAEQDAAAPHLTALEAEVQNLNQLLYRRSPSWQTPTLRPGAMTWTEVLSASM
ncbi:MAG: hypothetical protein HOV80_12060 [Polyangiaceae bacterium]|nr:hypothetical protein [Polyangiaceae bacterium]